MLYMRFESTQLVKELERSSIDDERAFVIPIREASEGRSGTDGELKGLK